MTKNTPPFSARVLELMASKICHDLVSPVGAINNGVEFWQEMGADSAEESMQLISHSANQAALRLKLFRLCYGAGGSEKHVSLKEIHQAISEFIGTKKYSIHWTLDNEDLDGSLPLGFCKTLLNLLVFVHDLTPKGAKIHVSGSINAVTIKAEADMVLFKDDYKSILDGNFPEDQLDPRSVHPFIAYLFVTHFGFALNYDQDEAGITFILSAA